MSSRQRIELAALSLLALHGYDGMSMQAVADAVGLHKSSLFHHYSGKLELAHSVVDSVMGAILRRAQARLSGDPPRLEQLTGLVEDLVDDFAAQPAAAKLLLQLVLSPEGAPLAQATVREDHPWNLLLMTLVDWFTRARARGVIRFVRIRHALLDLMGLIVFHPAAAEQMPYLVGDRPFGEAERQKRKEQVVAFVRAALLPADGV